MTNSEKAKEISIEYDVKFPESHATTYPLCYLACMEMARWKDNQYQKKLLDLLVETGADPELIREFIKNMD